MQAGAGRRMALPWTPREVCFGVQAALEYIREAEEKIAALEQRVTVLESSCILQAQFNTLQLRVDQLEQDLSSIQGQLAGPYNLGLRAELTALHKVLSGCVESVNRAEAEIRLLLSWRTRFSKVLQDELQSIGFRFASACPNFEPAYLDSLD